MMVSAVSKPSFIVVAMTPIGPRFTQPLQYKPVSHQVTDYIVQNLEFQNPRAYLGGYVSKKINTGWNGSEMP